MTHRPQTIAILGAGKLGITLAQLALRAGYTVYIAGSGGTEKIMLSVEILAPGAHAVSSHEAIEHADIVILAMPLGKFRLVPHTAVAGKLIIDATNYWWEVDGARDTIIDPSQSSSEAIQDFFDTAGVVKALNHMGYHDLHDGARPSGTPGRKAIAVAGDDKANVVTVSEFIDTIGFDPYIVGSLASGRALEPGGPVFGANVDLPTLTRLLDTDHTTAS